MKKLNVSNDSCKYFNESQKIWLSDGCVVLNYTNNSIACACNHLTSFAADFKDSFEDAVEESNLDNLDDLDKISNLNFSNAAALYVLFTITLIYVISVIIARKKGSSFIDLLLIML